MHVQRFGESLGHVYFSSFFILFKCKSNNNCSSCKIYCRYTSLTDAKRLGTMLHVTQTTLRDEYTASRTTLKQNENMIDNSGSIYYDIPLDDDETAYDSYDDCDKEDDKNQGNKVHGPKGSARDGDYTNREIKDGKKTESPESIQFDNEDVEFINCDSDLDWDNEPFDYTVPMDKPFIRERYSFETRANEGTLGFGAQQLVDRAAASVSSVQRRFSQTARQARPHLGRVARRGQAVASNMIAPFKIDGRRRDATTSSNESRDITGPKLAGFDATKENQSSSLQTSRNQKEC